MTSVPPFLLFTTGPAENKTFLKSKKNFLQKLHLVPSPLAVKSTPHDVYHFNHFQVCCSAASSTFTALCNRTATRLQNFLFLPNGDSTPVVH